MVAAFRQALPEAAVYVCDNGSDDGTADAATAAGATVIAEPRRGKGRAIRRLFREVDADIYLMADGDGTYDAKSAGRLVAALWEQGLDMVVGARRRADAHAYTPLRRLGNRLFTALARWRCGPQVHDLLSGYRAFSRRFVERFPARSEGFEIETELTLFAASSGLAWGEIECPYFARPQGSTSKLRTFHDGFRILRRLFQIDPAGDEASRVGIRRGVALVGAVTLVATAFFLALNWLAVRADPAPVAEALRTSYAHPGRTIQNSRESFNDCLLSLMTLDRGGSTLESTVSPRRVYRYTRPQRPCDALKQRLDQGAVDDSDYLTVFYHQYWAGQRVMLQWLLPRVGVDGLRQRLRLLTFGLLGLGLAGALIIAAAIATLPPAWEQVLPAILRRRLGLPPDPGERTDPLLRRQTLFQVAAFAALFGSLLLFLDLDDRAGSFTAGASNVLTVALLLAVGRLRIAHWRPSRQLVLFAAFGALIAYHELLFGSALIGLSVLLVALAIAPPPAPDHAAEPSGHPGDSRTWRRRLLIRCAGAYVGCLAAVFLLRVLLAELVFREPVLFKFWDQLTHRLYGAPRSSIHPDIDPFFASRPTLERTLERVGDHLGTVGLGSPISWLSLLIGAAAATLATATVLCPPPLVDPRRPLALGRHPRRRLVRPRLVRRLPRPHPGPRARDDPRSGAAVCGGSGAPDRGGDVPPQNRRDLKSRSTHTEISEFPSPTSRIRISTNLGVNCPEISE